MGALAATTTVPSAPRFCSSVRANIPCLIFPEPVLQQQMHQPRRPALHRPRSGRLGSPMHQPLPCCHKPAPTLGQRRLFACRQATRPSDQRRPAGLAAIEPLFVPRLPITQHATIVLTITHRHAHTPC